MKTYPWHSRLPNDPYVHHDETECHVGNNIEPENVVQGDGNRPKCAICKQISG